MGQWDALGAAAGSGGQFMQSFMAAKEQSRKNRLEDEKLAMDRPQYNPSEFGIENSPENLKLNRAEAVTLLKSQQGAGAYTLGMLLGLNPTDPRYGIPVGAKAAPNVVAAGFANEKAPEAASKQAADATAILSGAGALGKAAQDAAEEAKSGSTSFPFVQDVLPKFQGEYPATTKQVAPKLSAYLSQAQSTLDAIGRERSGGAINEGEWLSFRQFIPMPHDYELGPQAVEQKINALADQYARKLAAKADTIGNPGERERWKAEKLASVEGFRRDMLKSFMPPAAPSLNAASSPSMPAVKSIKQVR